MPQNSLNHADKGKFLSCLPGERPISGSTVPECLSPGTISNVPARDLSSKVNDYCRLSLSWRQPRLNIVREGVVVRLPTLFHYRKIAIVLVELKIHVSTNSVYSGLSPSSSRAPAKQIQFNNSC